MEKVIGYVFHEATMNEGELRSVEVKRNGVIKMEAVLQEANLPNRNGRVYPRTVLEKALSSNFIKEKLSTNSLLGEANHPENPNIQRQLNIDINNVSHKINRFYWDPKDSNLLIGELETAATDTGRNFAGLISENHMVPSFSMRGTGDVVKNGSRVTVKDPLRLVTYDGVNFPSHSKAYMRSLQESIETPIRISDLAQYAAENSKSFQQLNENFFQFAKDKVEFSFQEDGKQLVIIDKETSSPAGIILVERDLEREVNDALRKLMF